MRSKTSTRAVKGGASPAGKASPRTRPPDPSKTSVGKAKAAKQPVRIFVSYSHANVAYQEKLQIHLAALKRNEVETWFDGDMAAGDKLNTEISNKLRAAHVFVALMSPEYIHSHWCQLEYRRAMGRRAKGAMRVVVVVLRPCLWKDTGASELKVLPRDGRTVSDWRSMDHAFANVAEGIKGAVRAVRAAQTEKAKARPAKPARSPGVPKPKKPAVKAKGSPSDPVKARPAARAARDQGAVRKRAAR